MNPVYYSNKSSTYKNNDKLANVTSAEYYYEQQFGDYKLFGQGFLSSDSLKIGSSMVKQQLFVEMTTFGPLMRFYGYV